MRTKRRKYILVGFWGEVSISYIRLTAHVVVTWQCMSFDGDTFGGDFKFKSADDCAYEKIVHTRLTFLLLLLVARFAMLR